jgi:hypothetical protein
MLIVLRLLIFAVLVLVLWKIVALVINHRKQKPAGELKCVTCRHCDLIDRDGVMCRYGDSVTLKTIAHVHMCMDYEPDPARLGRG